MKIILKNAKIYGFDPSIYRTFDDGGKQYSVALYISGEDKAVIDQFLFNKVADNQDGEHIFYGKNKKQIPVFDKDRNRIEKPINEVFIADVSILIDEFTPKKKETDTEEPEAIRYSKCLGIKYISKVENEDVKIFKQNNYENFDEIFGEEEKEEVFSAVIKSETEVKEEPKPAITPLNDLPF